MGRKTIAGTTAPLDFECFAHSFAYPACSPLCVPCLPDGRRLRVLSFPPTGTHMSDNALRHLLYY